MAMQTQRAGRTVAPARVLSEELWNSVTHGFGLVLSVAGWFVLMGAAEGREHPGYGLSYAVFGGALVLMYAASLLYHSCLRPSLKRLLRLLDHIAIYLLIAGTYTPF